MITKEKFEAYLQVRDSGVTNMFDVNRVINLAEGMAGIILTKEDCFDIMKNFVKYTEKFKVGARQKV